MLTEKCSEDSVKVASVLHCNTLGSKQHSVNRADLSPLLPSHRVIINSNQDTVVCCGVFECYYRAVVSVEEGDRDGSSLKE